MLSLPVTLDTVRTNYGPDSRGFLFDYSILGHVM